MAWERVGSRRYYYRSERLAGWPVRRYVGTGPAAELAAAADDLRRLQRAARARELEAERDRRREAEDPLLALCKLTDTLTRAALVAAGYRQHDRGEWRRPREPNPNPTD